MDPVHVLSSYVHEPPSIHDFLWCSIHAVLRKHPAKERDGYEVNPTTFHVDTPHEHCNSRRRHCHQESGSMNWRCAPINRTCGWSEIVTVSWGRLYQRSGMCNRLLTHQWTLTNRKMTLNMDHWPFHSWNITWIKKNQGRKWVGFGMAYGGPGSRPINCILLDLSFDSSGPDWSWTSLCPCLKKSRSTVALVHTLLWKTFVPILKIIIWMEMLLI